MRKEVLLLSEELGVNSPLTHNRFATFSNKVWEVYFSKEVCSFVIIVDYVSACICIRIVVLRLYNTGKRCNILTFDRAVNQETGASGQRYRNITLTCGRAEFGADATPTGSRWASKNYITRCHRRLGSVSWSPRQAEFSSSCSRS